MKGKWSLAEALRANAVRLLSLIALLVAWSIIASFFDPTILPGPVIVLKEVYKIFSTGEFLVHMFATIRRVVIGFVWAFVFSVLIGLLMGLSRTCERFFEVEVLVGLTIPGMAWAMIAIMWFGIRDMAAIFAIFIIILPMITVNMWEGTKSIDKELIEMGQAFKAKRVTIIRHIILPQLVPYLFAGTRFGFALAWKVVVVSEIFGLSNGVGYKINESFTLFSIEGVLAWTISFTIIMIIVEFGLLKLIEERVTRWRPTVTI